MLECDRASVFLVDYRKGIMWTKSAKGSKMITLSLNQGIVGWVANQAKILNIPDAYKDHRFNPENDKRTNYRTKGVLCAPIFNH